PWSACPRPADLQVAACAVCCQAPRRPVLPEMPGMFTFLGRFTAAHAWKICAAWLAGSVLLTLLAPSWDTRTADDDIRFLPQRCDSVRGFHLLEQACPQDVFASRLIFAVERPGGVLTDADFALVDALVADLNQLRQAQPDLQIGRVCSHQ